MFVNGKVVRQTFHTTNTPIALKNRKCSLCGKRIVKGDRYVRYTWRKTHSIDTLPYHVTCWYVLKAYCKAKDTNIFTNEDAYEWIKTRRNCLKCTRKSCYLHKCEKVKKYVRYKDPTPKWETVKSMDEKLQGEGFKVLDE